MSRPIYIAVDFDGTIVEHNYPEIGTEVPHAVRVIKRLVDAEYHVILYTMRSKETLDEAVKWLDLQGVELKGINVNPTQSAWSMSPKVYANVYIDDAALGCPLIEPAGNDRRPYVNWLAVEELLIKQGLLKPTV